MWSSLRMILLKYSLLQRNQSCEQQRTPRTPFWNSKDLFTIRSWVFSLSDAVREEMLSVSAITAEETEVLCFLAQTSHFLVVTVLPSHTFVWTSPCYWTHPPPVLSEMNSLALFMFSLGVVQSMSWCILMCLTGSRSVFEVFIFK